MKKLFQLLKECMQKGDDAVLATVIASSGSTPRGAGARMLIGKGGRLYGTIGGGPIEYISEQLALDVLKNKKSYSKGFRLKPRQVGDLGMICGGDAVVYYQFISADDRETLIIIDSIIRMFDYDEDSWIVTDITDETAWGMGVYSKRNVSTKLNLSKDELRLLLKSRCIQMKIDEKEYYSEPLVKAGKVIIFGGGHIAQELVPVISHIGFRCVLMDDREEFANKELFPLADEIIIGDFDRILDSVNITKNDYAVIVTRGHNYDLTVQEQVLRTDAVYIGVIGSREKISATNAKLMEAGITKEAIGRINTPIGIPINAETPEEIAISIAGELIKKRAERIDKDGGTLFPDICV